MSPSRVTALSFAMLAITLLGCAEEYVPFARPYAYPRLTLPEQTSYVRFDNQHCPFTFEYPDFGKVTRNVEDSCWVNITFENFDATLHINGRTVTSTELSIEFLQEEHRRLIYGHSVKASRIMPSPLELPSGTGMKYEIVGEVGTPIQVFFHDKDERRSLSLSYYYRTATKNDSLAPVTEYMKAQVDHLIQSIEWK